MTNEISKGSEAGYRGRAGLYTQEQDCRLCTRLVLRVNAALNSATQEPSLPYLVLAPVPPSLPPSLDE